MCGITGYISDIKKDSDYFDIKFPPGHIVTEFPSDEERKCVIEYYEKNIKSTE